MSETKLLNLDLCASLGELRLERLSVVLGDAFLNSLRSLVNESLSFLQAEAGSFLDNLDDVDLVRASGLEDNVELGLLFSSRSSSSRSGNSDSSRSSSGNAELLFESLDELGELENGKSLYFFNKICNLLRHGMNLR